MNWGLGAVSIFISNSYGANASIGEAPGALPVNIGEPGQKKNRGIGDFIACMRCPVVLIRTPFGCQSSVSWIRTSSEALTEGKSMSPAGYGSPAVLFNRLRYPALGG